jgi:hypothetical protein
MSVTLDCTSAPFVRCGKKLKLNTGGGDSGSKKCKQGCNGAYGGVWRSQHFVGFVLVRLAGIWLQSL